MAENESAVNEGGIRTRLDNFWYHYKWHSIVAVLIIIAVLICSLQMCSKEDFDGYIMYAGGYAVSRTENNDVAEYVKFVSSFKKITPDTDKNGTPNPSFLDLYAPTDKELEDLSSEVYSFTNENFSRLQYELVSGSEYYICFLSVSNYEKYKIWSDVQIFTPLAVYVPDGTDVEYYDECAIYLNSLSFSHLEGIEALPDDTVVCLRTLSAVASVFNKGENERNRACAEEMLKNILKYQ